jgi:hypothetical protein
MTDREQAPRNASRDPDTQKPVRPSHQKVIEEVERWANSPGLQPPRMRDEKTV